jgi:hypothetical protein
MSCSPGGGTAEAMSFRKTIYERVSESWEPKYALPEVHAPVPYFHYPVLAWARKWQRCRSVWNPWDAGSVALCRFCDATHESQITLESNLAESTVLHLAVSTGEGFFLGTITYF